MNFDLTDDQRAIQRTAREFLAARYKPEEVRRLALDDERGFTDEQWSAIAELGWPGIAVAEDEGGLGLGVVELCVLQEQLGYALAPTPFFSTVAAAAMLAGSGDVVRSLATGERRGTVATVAGDDGTLIAVPDAGAADVLVVDVEGRDPVWVGADDFDAEPAAALDPSRKLFTVRVKEGAGEPLGAGAERARSVIATALAAESVGVAQRALEMAVTYAKDRQQFGRPIGAYQAVSHACAQMLLETEGARSTMLYAAWALDHEPESGPLAASMAKAYACDAGWRVAAASMQVHGGIGFTWEHDLHLFLKRARANLHAHGDPRAHRARVADLAGV